MSRSRRLVHAAVGGVVALSCTVLTAPAQAAPEADAPVGTVRLATEKRVTVDYPWAGASGFQYRPGTASVTTVDYPDAVPPAHAGPDDLASGTDVVNTRDGQTVTQRHRSTGVTATVTIPSGQAYRAAAGWSVLTMDGTGALHVLRTAEGTVTVDTPVTGFPAGARPVAYRTGGSVGRLAIVYVLDGKTSVGLVDLADGAFRTYVTSDEATPQLAFNDRWLVADWKAVRVDAEPGTEPTALTRIGAQLEAVVGDQLLIGNPDFVSGGTDPALTARSLVTGAQSTVLTSSFGGIGPTLDGGALATAGPSSLDWNIHRITPTDSGGLTTAEVARVPAASTGVQGLAVAGGELFLYGATTAGGGLRYSGFQLDADGRPTGTQTPRSPALGASTCLSGDAACPQLEAQGDGRVSSLWTNAAGQESVLDVGLDTTTILSEPTDGDSGGRLAGGTGRYVLYNGASGKQRLVDFPRAATGGETTLTRDRTAAAVWGQTLWTPGSTQGAVTGRNLKTGTTTTIATGAPCTPTDIQAVNTWLYWSCGGTAGVYDRATNRKITVPADHGPARLADGFLLRENRTTHDLLLTDFHTGTATTRTVVKLPATDQNTGGSNGRWAVDRFGGHIAYLNGTYGEVAIVPSGVPTSPLAQMEAQVYSPSVIGRSMPWSPVWQLNKPSTWTLTLTTASGTVVRTLTGSSTGAAVRPAWDGTTGTGAGAGPGPFTWRLAAHPRDGQGPDLTLSGTITLG